jgi:Sulfatase
LCTYDELASFCSHDNHLAFRTQALSGILASRVPSDSDTTLESQRVVCSQVQYAYGYCCDVVPGTCCAQSCRIAKRRAGLATSGKNSSNEAATSRANETVKFQIEDHPLLSAPALQSSAMKSSRTATSASRLYSLWVCCWLLVTVRRASGKEADTPRNNLLFILIDQLRWETLGFVQQNLPRYAGKVKIQTPNIDRLARLGVVFSDAYCVSPSCVPSRASIRTGTTQRRTGMSGNKVYLESVYRKMKIFEDRVNSMKSFEQLLVEE